MTNIHSHLNKAQHTAVTASPGHQLILAGAGSGKTRVLVHRIAYLIHEHDISPYSILAVTFTNKAAGEMRSRIESLLHTNVSGMWVGTFHGLAHRLLRAHWQEAGLTENFQILDSDDQYRMIRRIMKSLNIDDKEWAPKQVQWFINGKKDEGLRPHHIEAEDYTTQVMLKIYTAYEQACQVGGLVDFAELLLRAHELWLEHPAILQHYQQRFQYILVDEFQDTNTIQYAWLRLLAGTQSYLSVVGDDDQSIYGWRGAKIENIQRFNRDFPDAIMTRLEQNYRSSGNILAAANALISHNGNRLGKKLWTEDAEGEPISLYAAFNETDEARFIVNRIQDWVNQGNTRKEVAILYRSNAQSRILEESLLHANIPYRVYGGLRFYERAEIKDALAYLRLVSNRHDDAAFERVVNTPTRGIGDKTVQHVRDAARAEGVSLWAAAKDIIAEQQLSGRASNALNHFLTLIDTMADDYADYDLGPQTEYIIKASGLIEHYRKEPGEKAQGRIDNLEELSNATHQFAPEADETMTPLAAFLAHAALEAGESQADPYEDCIQLMTLHSAKGLEFPLVFMAGIEEGLFPHYLSEHDQRRLEEERRLCYVGMTRAMQKLFLCYAEKRRIHGTEKFHRPSRFLEEIPTELIQEVRMGSRSVRPAKLKHSSKQSHQGHQIEGTGLSLGQRVHHSKYGEGVVTNFEGQGQHARIQVQFSDYGMKWLVAAYAKLEPA